MKAQEYHPMPVSGASWDITRCWSFYPGGWHDEYSIVSDGTDTVINGRTYQNLILITHHLPGTQHDSVYTHYLGGMREEGKQVFFISEYLALDTFERMLYDFNEVSVGDTIFTQILTNGLTQFIPHIVTGLDAVNVGGESHRRISLRDENGVFSESWIEGVGSSLGLVYASYWQLTDNSYDLNCFYKQHQLQYTNPNPEYQFCLAPLPDITCEQTTLVPPDDLLAGRLYPNPVGDYLTIETDDAFDAVIFFDSYGRKVMTASKEDHIYVGDLLPGLYVIRFVTNGKKSGAVARIVKL
jgi:hypothetical protein